MPDQKTVLIADDHPLFRAGVRQSLEKEGSVRIVAEAANGEEALAKILELKPDVAVLDIQMPVMTGLTVAQRVEHMGLETRIVLLTMLEDKRVFLDAMEHGVKGYLLKDSVVSEIGRAIESVCQDRHYISPSLSGLLIDRNNRQPLSADLQQLTPTELRVLKLIADLKSNQDIADEMLISKRTVENHRVNMARKLRLTGTNALLKLALQHRSRL